MDGSPQDLDASELRVDDGGLSFLVNLIPWDTEVFGYPVAELQLLGHVREKPPSKGFLLLDEWRTRHRVRLVYCRLPVGRLVESMLLEQEGFRFIEVVLHPTISLQQRTIEATLYAVLEASAEDVDVLAHMAKASFRHERYHADPRTDSVKASDRYARWVRDSANAPGYSLLKVVSPTGELLAFFAVEEVSEGRIAWRLTAVAPEFRGRGLGAGIWNSVLAFHRNRGIASVVTTISSANVTVLNLYSHLGFRFDPPEMTFHWAQI